MSFRIALLTAGLAPLAACGDSCGNQVVARTDAPDGRHSAVMFQRDCGATTGFSTQISVVERGAEPRGTANAFRADTSRGAATAGPWGGPWAEMSWRGESTLLVRYARGSRIFAQEGQVAGVTIHYQEVAR